jgi:hypothetical protein
LGWKQQGFILYRYFRLSKEMGIRLNSIEIVGKVPNFI